VAAWWRPFLIALALVCGGCLTSGVVELVFRYRERDNLCVCVEARSVCSSLDTLLNNGPCAISRCSAPIGTDIWPVAEDEFDHPTA